MTEHRAPDVRALLDRHTPDADERPDWPRVVREASRPASNPRRLRHMRWIPGLVGAAALVALLTALIVAVPGGGPTSAPPEVATSGPTRTLRAYIRDDATGPELAQMRADLEALRRDGRVASFRYESKAEGLRRLRARLKDPSILDDLKANPVPASYAIGLASSGEATGVVQKLRSEPAIDARLGVR